MHSQPPSTILSQPYDFMGSFARACEICGESPAQQFDLAFNNGYVIKTPTDFLLVVEQDDTWYIQWAETTSRQRSTLATIQRFLRHIPPDITPPTNIAWTRSLKGRTMYKFYSTSRLLRLVV